MNTPRKKRHTAQDVADRAGVSRFTVKRAFSKDASIAEDTRTRILQVAADLGYRPNAMARSLKTQESALVGIVTGALDNQYDSEVVNRLVARIITIGKWPVVFGGSADELRQANALKILDFPLSALILRAGSIDPSLAEECIKMGVPVIVSGRILHIDGPIDSIACDNAAGAAMAAECLLSQGRRKLAHLGGPLHLSSEQERATGFTKYLRDQDVELVAKRNADYSFQGGYAAAMDLLQNNPEIDGLFCSNDAMALGALMAARQACNLSVPDDLGIIGFDDIDMAAWPGFELTTIQNHAATVAERILDQLRTRLSDPDAPATQRLFPPELVLRKTH